MERYENNSFDKLNDLYKMPGEEGYVAPKGVEDDKPENTETGTETQTELKIGDEGYVLKEGDEGYVAPNPEAKEGEPGYVAPVVAPKEGEEGYVAPVPAAPVFTQEQKDELFNQMLKERGIDSFDTITELQRKAAATPETPEQEAARLADYNTKLLAFGIQEKIITSADVAAIETLAGQDDRAIAMSDFAVRFREANKSRVKEGTTNPDPVTEDEITEAFEQFYHIDSDNPTFKANGEELIAQKAAALRESSTSKLASAKQRYDAKLHSETNVPAYKNFIQSTMTSSIPEQLKFEVPGGTDVVFNLKDDQGKPLYDVAALEKELVNDNTYNMFLEQGKHSELREYIQSRTLEYLERTNSTKIRKLLWEQAESSGLKKGSTTGATAPFKANKDVPPVPTSDKILSEGDKSNLKQQFESSRR